MIKEAFKSLEIQSEIHSVENGQDVLDYLRHQGKYLGGDIPSPRPDLILLDLNMPRKNGREVLQEIKSDPARSCIPIIILSTSSARKDVTNCYDPGANSFITKPASYGELVRIADVFCHYWMRVATFPQQEQQRGTP